MKRLCFAVMCLVVPCSAAQGQQVPAYPAPLLAAVTPPGAKAGNSALVSLSGVQIDGATALYFSHPAIKASLVPNPPADPKKNTGPLATKFIVNVPPQVAVGAYDVRVIARGGISNPRVFVVSDQNEVVEKEPNSDVAEAQKVAIGSVVNGVIGANLDVDYFSFTGKQGQRVVIHCAAAGIDSRLQPQVAVYGQRNREVAAARKEFDGDVVVDCLLPADGDYIVRVCEFTYLSGGVEHTYRLAISQAPWIDAVYPPVAQAGTTSPVTLFGKNLPGGQPDLRSALRGRPLEKANVQVTAPSLFPGGQLDWMLPRLASVDGFSYRVQNQAGLSNPAFLLAAEGPVLLDNEDNDSRAKAQPVPAPCVVCGKIEKRGDRDFYVFDARQGETLCIEGFADRICSPLDLSIQLRRRDNDQLIGLYDDNPEVPSAVERFVTATDDPKTKFVVPADGKYELLVRSLMGDLQAGPRHVYAVSLRKPRPDFHVVLVGNHESGAGLTLRQGSSHYIQAICFRHDDFNGEVLLSALGLPPGVTCPPQVIGPMLQQTALVLTASPDAPDWAGEIKVTAEAVINDARVVRPAQAGCLVNPTAAPNILAVSRLARSVCLAVRSKGPFRLETSDTDITVPLGGQVKTRIKVARQKSDYKDNVEVNCIALPTQGNGKPIAVQKVNIGVDRESEIKFQLPSGTPQGTYNLVFRGTGKLSIEQNKKKVNVQFAAVTPPIRLQVFDTVVELVVTQQAAIKPGGELTLPVKVNRLKNFKGELTVELVLPAGLKGISAANVKIPPGANDAAMVIKAAKDAKIAVISNLLVRATAKVGSQQLRDERRLQLAVATDPAAFAQLQDITLLPERSGGWKYTLASSVKGDAWRGIDFDDRKWKSVKAPFGYGEPEIQNRGGTQISAAGAALACRHLIDIPESVVKTKGLLVQLQVASDNSAVVYINGKVVDQDTDDHEFMYWNRDITIDANLLRSGKNVVAVLVNNTAGSSDAYLDMAIIAQGRITNAKK